MSGKGKGEPVPITKRGMAKLGVEFQRLHVTCLDVVHITSKMKRRKFNISVKPTIGFETKTTFVEIATVLSHFMLILAPLLIVIPTIINSNAWSQFNPLPNERKQSIMSIEARIRTFSNYDLQNLVSSSMAQLSLC